MAELLVASGSRKISALTSVNGISGSTSMPIVMGGNTVQVSHTDFLNSTIFNRENTFTKGQIISSNTANYKTLLFGDSIDMFMETGNLDTFRVEVGENAGVKMFDFDFSTQQLAPFLEIGTNSGPISLFRDTAINGDLQVNGNLIATQYIVSSSVSHITSSFSSGSTIFGDTLDDTHQFTGSVLVNGGINAQSFTGSLNFTNLTNRPTLVSGSSQISFNGIIDKPTLVSGSSQVSFTAISNRPTLVSGSSQISFNGIIDKPTLFSSSIQVDADTITNFDANVLSYNNSLGVVSGSSQVSYPDLSNIPNGIISSSAQIDLLFDIDGLVSSSDQVIELLPNGTVSGSSQVSFNGIVDKPTLVSASAQITYSGISSIPIGIVSSSTQVLNYGIFATTGSNNFVGNQTITGSLLVSGSSTFTNIGLVQFTGSFNSTGSSNLTGSIVINQLTYPTPNFADGQYGVEVPTLGVDNVFELDIPKTIYEYVKNDSGTTLLKGTPVHSVGAVGFNTLVIAASASNAATMPATFILAQDLDSEEEGLGIAIGAIQGVDTTGLTAGDPVYVAPNGGWTQTKPTGSNLIQNLGIVTRVGENGGGVVLGAGRSNDVPNIEEGYFWVGNSGSVATPTPTSSFAVTSSANTFYGTQTISGSLNIDAGNITILRTAGVAAVTLESTATNGEATLTLTGKNSSGTVRSSILKYDNLDVLRLGTASPIPIRFETNDVGRLTIASGDLGGDGSVTVNTGNLVIGTAGKGIDFSATPDGSGTTTSELLDDYEEGTWTGTLKGSVSDPSTPVTATGYYTKVGNKVFATIAINNATTTGASGIVTVSGLPFTSASTNNSQGSVMCTFYDFNGGTSLVALLGASSSEVSFLSILDDGDWNDVLHVAGSGRSLRFSITYFV